MRFDAPASSPVKYGVCYLGLEQMTCYLEVVGRIGTVDTDAIASKRLSGASTTKKLRMADLTVRMVVGTFGVNRAHSTSDKYEQSQELSKQLYSAGFDGIVYRARHDPQGQHEAAALFGTPIRGTVPSVLHWGPPRALPPQLIAAGRKFGIQVLPPVVAL